MAADTGATSYSFGPFTVANGKTATLSGLVFVDEREQRGLVIAATIKLRRKGSTWIVPSQVGHGTYTVNLKGEAPTCSCPDYETRQQKCKHVHAVEFTVKREIRPDGSSQVTKTVRITYSQSWPAYNMAEVHEKERVAELLFGLCEGIAQPKHGRGRPSSLW
jgi:hypothetical protein